MKKITKYEVTDAQRQAIAAGIAALGEVVQAHQIANPHYTGFEINLKVTHEKNISCWEKPAQTWGFFQVGSYLDGSGCGHSLDAALAEMFGKTDASEKRASAERCRKHADQLETEAAEMERAQAAEAR